MRSDDSDPTEPLPRVRPDQSAPVRPPRRPRPADPGARAANSRATAGAASAPRRERPSGGDPGPAARRAPTRRAAPRPAAPDRKAPTQDAETSLGAKTGSPRPRTAAAATSRTTSGRTAKRSRTPEQALEHGHGHGHSDAAPASTRVRRLLLFLLAPLALATLVAVGMLFPWGGGPEHSGSGGTPVDGVVTAAAAGPCLSPGQVQVGEPAPDDRRCLSVDVRLDDGPGQGSTITKILPIEPSSPRFAVGDEVVLAYGGADPTDAGSYQLRDFQRGVPLLLLGVLFAAAVLLLGRWQGLASLVALGITFAVIALFVLPAILAGRDPLLVAIAAAGLIMFIALYVTHGFSARTSVAVLGTIVSLTLIGVLSAVFSAAADLTGLDTDTSTLIGALGGGIDARGLLLAGIVIGALGVLDDVTVAQASAVWELRRANPALSWRSLYAAGLRIGRAHVGSAVNTLVLAYAGAALPLLLLSSLADVGLSPILQSQDVAQELVRTLAGSIGIIAAVPLTTVLAALVAVRDEPVEAEPGGDDVHDAADTTDAELSPPASPRTG
ncbi:YibE/F family protein [Saccharomonospora azurea]|uniref:YibE/F family protein n=1 Tax=Saccharomonospora azurea TaxID=40988 RepID=UPI003323762E